MNVSIVVNIKWNIGDDLFYIRNGKVIKDKVQSIYVDIEPNDKSEDSRISYKMHDGFSLNSRMGAIPENRLFETKEELIASL